ncbi:MAG: hypothetical protein A3K14_10155 [Sulfurimonas sp. RIFCSPLOWO2_12_FULL_36_74]|uniref:hypothetical protein n=1 Tax=Sulfurimonas sp. RIFCSPLOWO2_12_36_12 TaxID=1802253 RepID=UPI0008BA011E|nr:hypothetical protein [Sulfurimonas sp. RIFCSPLOWO2_12_36_12]OHE02826.1 MAG: hypothetical protein A2W82_01060 [Sulfurimonas sp. RIFCSPLOWO2_12_36_12]OHE03323.1 MAG: hypothetical protein A3K14_10155 [Sulfurimonas sp. RIFCSPLOWO2_12_FULL_36_74]
MYIAIEGIDTIDTMINNYLYGNRERLFLNTNLGCNSKCSYCYLPSLDLTLGKTPNNTIQTEKLLEMLNGNTDFQKGKDGTILSLGCYSECWDEINKEDTINLINILLEYQNPIQLATKKYINEDDFCKINLNKIKHPNHLSIFISSSTITQFQKYEKGTIDPMLRFDSFKIQSKYHIPMYLYIKPILENITTTDIDLYIQIIEQYGIDAIAGELFTTKEGFPAPIAKGRLYYENNNNDYDYIISRLSKYCKVFKHSVEPIKEGIKK